MRNWAAILLIVAIGLLMGVIADWHRTDVPGGNAWIATASTITLAILAGFTGIGGIVLAALSETAERFLAQRDAKDVVETPEQDPPASPPLEEPSTPKDDS